MAKVFYLGGLKYSTDTSVRLCSSSGIFETTTLYRTINGAFFTVCECLTGETKANVLTESEAHSFMDANASQIDIEKYNSVFGVPKDG
ncbi:MAG: hypothetical protein IJT44_07465 [Clostridia bacterium]|nr:hypothetical protein [Clostridia bacterium]